MSWTGMAALLLLALGVVVVVFLVVWSRVSRQLREMEPREVPKVTVLQAKRKAGWK